MGLAIRAALEPARARVVTPAEVPHPHGLHPITPNPDPHPIALLPNARCPVPGAVSAHPWPLWVNVVTVR